MKLCLIYNFAQHYRTGIFRLISEHYDSDFFFGDSMGDVKKMNYSLLRGNVTEMHIKRGHGLSWQSGVVGLLRKPYTHYLLLGDTRSVSTWLFLLLSIFHPKKKIYLWTHGWYGKENGLVRGMKKLFFRLPNGGTFLYGNYARELMIKEGFDCSKLYTIHNSLDYDRQQAIRKELSSQPIYSEHFGNKDPVLAFIGRLTPVKKLNMILDALDICRKRGHSFNLVIIGTGSEENALKEKTASLGLQSQVWFYGPCYDESQIGNLIYNADLCVSPGNVGLTAMHTLVYGTPVLTHNDFPHQMPEFEAIRQDATGAFFKYGDINSLAEEVMAWFEKHSGDRQQIRENCFNEIDTQWTPQFQLKVLKSVIDANN